MGFNTTWRNLGRLRQIIAVLVKYGFEDLVANSTLRNFVPENLRIRWLRQDKPALQYTRWERIRMAAEELGPTFVKMAQVLSNRPDIIPEPLVKEFEKLQDRVPPFSSEEAISILEYETGQPLGSLFEEFNPVPMASASIGQVHKARLIGGRDVVVKIQRPGIREMIERDLALLHEIVRRADRYLKKQGILNAQDILAAFEKSILKELDYHNEARNMVRFRELYKNYRNFYIPKPYREYSTDKVLVIEYVSGCKFTDVKQLRAWGIDPRSVVVNGFQIYLTQIFEFGIFHADPHPGNVLVRPDSTICLLDFGMVGMLSRKDRYAFANVFVAMASNDARMMANNLKRLAIEDEIHDMRQFESDLQEIIDEYAQLSVAEGSLAELTADLQQIFKRYRMVVPPGIFLIFRALAILEGIGRIMYPDFETYKYVKPFGAKILQDQWKPQNVLSEVQYRGEQVVGFLSNFPLEVREFLRIARKGRFHMEVELQGYGYLLKKLDSLTNRLIFTFIICALLIGASILATVSFPPELRGAYGLPVVSIFGYVTAGCLFIIVLYAIIRRRIYK
ncbi:MAG: AarF/ABC1/UbiB kinase family protein [Flavobacteriales bacterium]|nr:AarF/ABC1/UbiB kinase family protein [Flavobacteriales bacterium]MCX7768748.1 AarF/ABC1/UbiB kinase family protein [Flavobacteriales bacterium]MDW8409907.1 AarF/ABC1/UbiB kinase family protein [Flavobacteriales bacterium]